MKLDLTLEQSIYSWLESATGLTVVAENAKHTNPEILGDFASYNVEAPIKVGSDELVYKINDTFTIKALRLIPIEVRIYAENALEKGMSLQLGLSSPIIRENYFNDFGFLSDDKLQDISAGMDTGYENRCLLTFSLTMGVGVDQEVGYINQVNLETEMDTLLNTVELNKIINGG